jgi:hypothetical protein
MPTPMIIPIRSHSSTIQQTTGKPYFIESSKENEWFNISGSNICGIYEQSNKWWIWFDFPSGSCKYYTEGFPTKEQARQKLLQIIGNDNDD